METVIQDCEPLANYIKATTSSDRLLAMTDQGEETSNNNWPTPPASASDSDHNGHFHDAHDDRVSEHSISPPSSPNFAPVGRPMVRKRFRKNAPEPIHLEIPHRMKRYSSLGSLHDSYSVRFYAQIIGAMWVELITYVRGEKKAVTARIDRADNQKFIEQFRYTIVASQLLSGHSVAGLNHFYRNQDADASKGQSNDVVLPNSTGLIATAAGALVVALGIRWLCLGGYTRLTKRGVLITVVVAVAVGMMAHFYIRKQWLRYVRNKALAEVATFVAKSQDWDSATSAALSLIQEVELVSRGYRLSAPLPPISRIEDRSQTRRCGRLRKALKQRFADMIKSYIQVTTAVKGLSEQLDLEKYYDVYDITDFDISDAMQGFPEDATEEAESLRVLKIAAARFHTIRKLLLCALLAFEATGDNSDFVRWSTAAQCLNQLSSLTGDCYERLRLLLSDEESFPAIPETKFPLSPNREKRRTQFRKLNSLSTGIRGLQAKLALLREESEKALNEADDISEVGFDLMSQYESIGQDLKMLQQAWEDGKAALASGIDRNEKRISSMSMLYSPSTSLSGLTTVGEENETGGGAEDALKALNGETSPTRNSSPGSNEPDVFEAVALPTRPRSMLTRDERRVKVKEERDMRAMQREKQEASRGMLKELEMVINLRPKRHTTAGPAGGNGGSAAPTRISL
ncbi:Mysoin-binding motif of peroxisomes-domain-containing protein [Neurospora tetraspora]|uniref:Vezatin n=1 Tax=Neurospora tetraspora TaxID=94610 RepID=A0AAE0JR27_9PEZI|nr:Mysoin-binding motif of peroxisomes-domain-containing protein [Neurospora tetraspora]